jgi:hypothetical protein
MGPRDVQPIAPTDLMWKEHLEDNWKKKKKNIDWTFDEIKELFLILEWGDLCF